MSATVPVVLVDDKGQRTVYLTRVPVIYERIRLLDGDDDIVVTGVRWVEEAGSVDDRFLPFVWTRPVV